ncbi:hypothetical protein E2C01_026668 [Portunus trituberculatus]|uniref:Transmembrane protein 98 n=1 Tax=Portunus trituberculatus TaxID=210409 RepID=A0A5B7ELL8_PORTR|nr:hypothetical protein [Portunus trituberculatus]
MLFTLNLSCLTISGLVAVLAHSDWLLPPAQLRHRHLVIRARITETVSTLAAVVDGVQSHLADLTVLQYKDNMICVPSVVPLTNVVDAVEAVNLEVLLGEVFLELLLGFLAHL